MQFIQLKLSESHFRCYLLIFFLLMLASQAQAGNRCGYYYLGTIGNANPIQANLYFDGNSVSGTYFYESTCIDIDIDGTITKPDAVSLTEKIDGDTTGTFQGTLSSERTQYSGTWTSADGKRHLPFSLHAIAEYRDIHKKIGALPIDGSYPYFLNPSPALRKLSQICYGIVASNVKTTTDDYHDEKFTSDQDGSYLAFAEIAYYSPSIVSIQYGDEADIPGDAHPSGSMTGANYLISGKSFSKLMLKDFFDTKQDYFPQLIKITQEELIIQNKFDSNPFTDSPLQPNDFSRYTIRPHAITFYFDLPSCHYSIQATIPWKKLTAILKPNNPLLKEQ